MIDECVRLERQLFVWGVLCFILTSRGGVRVRPFFLVMYVVTV